MTRVSPILSAVAPRLALAHAQRKAELERRCARVGCANPPKSLRARFCSDKCRYDQWVSEHPESGYNARTTALDALADG